MYTHVQPLELEEIPLDTTLYELTAGKIPNIDQLFPEWDDSLIQSENWTEPIPAEHARSTAYPKHLNVFDEVSLVSFFGLEPLEPAAVDPKGKKDSAKKDKKGGAVEAPVALTDSTHDESGRPLPMVFKSVSETAENGSAKKEGGEDLAYQQYNILRKFTCYQREGYSTASEVDPFMCGAYRIVERFAPTIVKAKLTSLAVVSESIESATKDIEEERQILAENFLWRSIYPKLSNGKPVYNPSGKYCVRLFLANKWRCVYVDDKIPVLADGTTPAVSSSEDRYELWPILIAKAVYAVYSACG